jgi:predicted enzyme related to lactoylglutathione lyase
MAQDDRGVDTTLARHGGLSYLEIPALDVQKSALFYAKILGWNIDGAETDHPKFMDRSKHLLGRWISGRPIAREPGLLPYFYVDRIHSAVESVTAYGGEIVKPPYGEGDLLVCTVRDAAGNLIGLWQDKSR